MCVRYRKWLLLPVSGGMDRCYNHWSYNYNAIVLKDAGSCARLSSWHIHPAHVLSETHFKYPCLIHRENNAVVVRQYSTPGSYYHIWYQPRWLSGLTRSSVHSQWLLVDQCVLSNWDRILVRAVKGLISRAGMVSICPLLWQRDVKLQQTNKQTNKQTTIYGVYGRLYLIGSGRHFLFVWLVTMHEERAWVSHEGIL